jgi:TPR repeat protein
VSAKPAAAEAVPTRSAEAKQLPRSRQKDALLMEGDEQLLAGEVEAARATYQEAFDRGSVEAARRLAQTFDPRNVSANSTEASAAEAILWYKDAAKRGDRRARGELQGLESWLEDAAASGNSEARRVLKTWRAPSPADDPAGGSQAEP